jgi:glutamine amidotransferase
MCRWVAYSGPEILLEDIIFNPDHSLVHQSLSARESIITTNADGFGVAWYGARSEPGLFKDILPAWHDENLRSLSRQIASSLFFAHVRASTGTGVTRANCHPFTFENWSFMHNGKLGGWTDHRREYESLIEGGCYKQRLGTTDSEALFLIALSNGLREDPLGGLTRALSKILHIQKRANVAEPTRISAALSDGKSIWALRYSSDSSSPTMYVGAPFGSADEDSSITTIASEPFDTQDDHWRAVEEGTFLHVADGAVAQTRICL